MSTFHIPETLSEAKRYFQTNPDLQEVLSHRKSPHLLQWTAPHSSWSIQSTGNCLLSCFLRAIEAFAALIGAHVVAKRCANHVYHLKTPHYVSKAVSLYGDHLLIPFSRAHRLDTEDLFLQSPPSPLYENPSFYHPRGMCRGVSEWFLSLYLRTRHRFFSSKDHIRAVGKVFEHGAPYAAALIQSMNAEDISWKALKLEVTMNVLKEKFPRRSSSRIAKKIYRLPKGTYGVYFLGKAPHRVNFIRESKGKRYLIDPTWGCIRVPNALFLQKAIQADLNSKTTVAVDSVRRKFNF